MVSRNYSAGKVTEHILLTPIVPSFFLPIVLSIYEYVPIAPTWSTRASVKRFVLFQSLNLRQLVRLPGQGTRPSQGRCLTQTQIKRRQTSMPWVGFESTIPVFQRTKTFHTLDRTVTVIGSTYCTVFQRQSRPAIFPFQIGLPIIILLKEAIFMDIVSLMKTWKIFVCLTFWLF
jgi:hypothetical protein